MNKFDVFACRTEGDATRAHSHLTRCGSHGESHMEGNTFAYGVIQPMPKSFAAVAGQDHHIYNPSSRMCSSVQLQQTRLHRNLADHIIFIDGDPNGRQLFGFDLEWVINELPIPPR